MTEVIDSLDFVNTNLFQKHGFFLHILPRWLKRARWLLDFATTFFQRERMQDEKTRFFCERKEFYTLKSRSAD